MKWAYFLSQFTLGSPDPSLERSWHQEGPSQSHEATKGRERTEAPAGPGPDQTPSSTVGAVALGGKGNRAGEKGGFTLCGQNSVPSDFNLPVGNQAPRKQPKKGIYTAQDTIKDHGQKPGAPRPRRSTFIAAHVNNLNGSC